MPEPSLDAARLYPITLPDGTPHLGTVQLSQAVDHPRMSIGAFTYASDFDPPAPDGWAARLAPYLFSFAQDRLIIGKYCQIAHGVRFVGAAANHATRGISTYPFAVMDPDTRAGYQPDTRDTHVGHDVWLGYGALILPGTHIGNGAIIGAGAVVRGSVPDYAVVTGNPACVQRMRFSETDIARLNALAWWNWPAARVMAARTALEAADIDTLEALAP